MKINHRIGAGVFLHFLAIGAVNLGFAQEVPMTDKVKIKTVMEDYAPDLVVPVAERRRLKAERYLAVRERRAVIDTLDISNRQRKKLLKELYRTPLSEEYEKVLGTLQPEEPLDQGPD